MHTDRTPTALITGASRGLGLALTRRLVADGWRVVATARGAAELEAAVRPMAAGRRGPGAVALPGDVTDPVHRTRLMTTAGPDLDLLVNNASALGPSPLPRLAHVPLAAVEAVLATNVLAPLGLIRVALPALHRVRGVVVDVSSDAAVEAYEGWGAYGLSKAALDQLTAVLAVEHPDLSVYAVDPGDMRTAMHQAAFPGEDIGDRPLPEAVVPALVDLVTARPPSGRYRLVADAGGGATWVPAGRAAGVGA